MRIITTREFRENQKSYFDLAEKEKVIVHRGKNRKPVLLTPIEESEESDIYFSNPSVIAKIKKGINDVKDGKVKRVTLDEIKELLGL